MLNIYYEPDSGVYTFIQNNEESMFSMDLEELLIAVAHSIALLARKKEGSLEEAYDKCAQELYDFGTQENVNAEMINIIANNEDQVFMANESKEQAVRHIAYEFKEGVDAEAEEFAEHYGQTPQEFAEGMTKTFIEIMKETYDVDVSSIFNTKSDYEDDLF